MYISRWGELIERKYDCVTVSHGLQERSIKWMLLVVWDQDYRV